MHNKHCIICTINILGGRLKTPQPIWWYGLDQFGGGDLGHKPWGGWTVDTPALTFTHTLYLPAIK